jgi:hypothetical protein
MTSVYQIFVFFVKSAFGTFKTQVKRVVTSSGMIIFYAIIFKKNFYKNKRKMCL